MTYLEMTELIIQRGEKVLANDVRSMITDQHRYLRTLDGGESPWQQDMEPGAPERKYGKSGEYFIWKRQEELPDPPVQFPEGT